MKNILFLLFSIATFGQVSTGQETPFDYGIQNTAAQLVGNSDYVVTQGNDGTYGKYLFNLNKIDKKQDLSTGLIKNGTISINADPTKYNISAGIGVITNYDNPEIPTCTVVNFPAVTGKTPTYLTTGLITYVAVNSSGVIVEQATQFTTSQRRDLIILGAVIHSNLTTINVVNNISAPTNADTNQLHDLMTYIGALNLTGNKYTENGANLSLDKSAGSIFKAGVNFATDWKKPHELEQSLQTLLTFRYRLSNGTEYADATVLNPAVYESGGTLISVPSNKFTIQTVTMFQTGLTRIQPGQNIYNSLAEAESAILTRSFVVETNIAANGITRAYVILRNSATSLQNINDAKIIETTKFGGVASGGVSLSDAAIIAALGYTPENVANKSNTYVVDGTGTKYYTVDYLNAKLPTNYTTIVYVNSTSPNTATIFDDINPPVTNDDALKLDTANLYIGTDASTWVYNGSTYVTKTVPTSSNFYIESTTTDAGSNKTSNIQRSGGVVFGNYIYSYGEIVSKKASSDTVLSGSNFRLFNNAGTDGNVFQLNASNGIDVWNYGSGVWNKRFTFSSSGIFSATTINAGIAVRKISTNTTLADSDNGKVILLTASCTVTLPNGLMNGFNCSFSTLAGVTMTYALGGSVTLLNNTGTTMAEKLSHTIVNTGVSNEYLTAGSL